MRITKSDSDRQALDQAARNGVLRWRHGYGLLMLEQVLDCPLAHGIVRKLHRGQWWRQLARDQLVVVEAYDGHVLRDREAELLHGLIGAHSHRVVETKQARRPLGRLQQLHRAAVPLGRATGSLVDEVWIERHPAASKRLLVAHQSTARRWNAINGIDEG